MIETELWNTPEEAELVRRAWDREHALQEPVVGYRAAMYMSRPLEFGLIEALLGRAYLLIADKAEKKG